MVGYFEIAQDVALSPRIAAFDARFGAVVRSWRTPAMTELMRAATWSANTLTVTALVLTAIAILLWRGDHGEALLTPFVVALGNTLGSIAKRATERPRPPAASALVHLPDSFSFPSGHTLAALLFWTMIAFCVLRVARRRWTRVLAVLGGLALAVLVGVSRVYLGVHWPSDVLASWLLGTALLSVVLGAFLTWERAYG